MQPSAVHVRAYAEADVKLRALTKRCSALTRPLNKRRRELLATIERVVGSVPDTAVVVHPPVAGVVCARLTSTLVQRKPLTLDLLHAVFQRLLEPAYAAERAALADARSPTAVCELVMTQLKQILTCARKEQRTTLTLHETVPPCLRARADNLPRATDELRRVLRETQQLRDNVNAVRAKFRQQQQNLNTIKHTALPGVEQAVHDKPVLVQTRVDAVADADAPSAASVAPTTTLCMQTRPVTSSRLTKKRVLTAIEQCVYNGWNGSVATLETTVLKLLASPLQMEHRVTTKIVARTRPPHDAAN